MEAHPLSPEDILLGPGHGLEQLSEYGIAVLRPNFSGPAITAVVDFARHHASRLLYQPGSLLSPGWPVRSAQVAPHDHQWAAELPVGGVQQLGVAGLGEALAPLFAVVHAVDQPGGGRA